MVTYLLDGMPKKYGGNFTVQLLKYRISKELPKKFAKYGKYENAFEHDENVISLQCFRAQILLSDGINKVQQ